MNIEQEIQAKATGPRVTPADIEAAIASEHYFTAADGLIGAQKGYAPLSIPISLGLLTFCVLVLRNGFTVTGQSACASPANFDAEIGRKVARADAVRQVWPLLGYALRERIHSAAIHAQTVRSLAVDTANDPQQEPLTFGVALDLLNQGVQVARLGWNGKGMWLDLQRPDAGSKMTLPYLFLNYPAGSGAHPEGARVPWLASQTDMLAQDWVVVGASGYYEDARA